MENTVEMPNIIAENQNTIIINSSPKKIEVVNVEQVTPTIITPPNSPSTKEKTINEPEPRIISQTNNPNQPVLQPFDICLHELLNQITSKNIEINPNNIMKILYIAITIAEKSPEKGMKQKDLVFNLIDKVIRDSSLHNDLKIMMINLLRDGIVSDTIELVIDATHGKLDINKVVETAKKGCFTCCFKGKEKKTV